MSTSIAVMDTCPPLCCEPLEAQTAEAMAQRLKALGDPTRLRLFSLISASGKQCACDLTEPLGVSQPTVSHHLRVLLDAGLLEREQRGKWAYFTVREDTLDDLSGFLDPKAVVS